MPMYAYECKENGHQFEVRQSFDDDPVSECPECGSPVRRLIQPAGILFKGSGFYVTDNKKAKSPTATPASANGKSNGSGSTSDSSSDSGSESKAESKTESKSSSTEKASSPASSSD